MNLAVLLDENIPPEIGVFIRKLRPEWYVRHVYDYKLAGADDAVVFRQAQALEAAVITFDEDFADTRMYPAGTHAGVIRLRVWPTTVEEIEKALKRLFDTTPDDVIPKSLIIIDNTKIRIRHSARHR